VHAAGSISDKLSEWQQELIDDSDQTFLIDGIANGFRITEEGSVFKPACQENHQSTQRYKKQVEAELVSQIALGNYVCASKQPTVVSALGAIPKSDGSVRLIHDGSRPVGTAMNNYSNPDPVRFQTLQDACSLAKSNYFMAKVDLQAAYRSVPIHPDDYAATGLKWTFGDATEPTYIFDTRLPFGSNKGPGIFNKLSQAIRRCMVRRGFRGLVAYIDDFFICAPTYEECKYWMDMLIRLVRKLGLLISWKKVEGPVQRLTFLGVQIDTKRSTVSLDQQKLSQLQQELWVFSKRTRASKQQLQSLAGKLNWASNVIRGGRFFLRRIINSMSSLKQQRHKTQLGSDFYADLSWWLTFLETFNGTAYYTCDTQHVHVDACNAAAGSFWLGQWEYIVFHCDMPKASRLHINYKEICAVVRAVDKWSQLWQGHTVVFHTDSTVTKAVINKGWSKNVYINSLLRRMAWKCAKLNIRVKAAHVSGSINTMADTISRLHEPGRIYDLLQLLSRWHHGHTPNTPLKDHMSIQAFLSLFYRRGN
jgi:hypothetical protein